MIVVFLSHDVKVCIEISLVWTDSFEWKEITPLLHDLASECVGPIDAECYLREPSVMGNPKLFGD